jgi:hypothetical protein
MEIVVLAGLLSAALILTAKKTERTEALVPVTAKKQNR